MEARVDCARGAEVTTEEVNRVDRHLAEIKPLLSFEDDVDEGTPLGAGLAPHASESQMRGEGPVFCREPEGGAACFDDGLEALQHTCRLVHTDPHHTRLSEVREAPDAANPKGEGRQAGGRMIQRITDPGRHVRRCVTQKLECQVDTRDRNEAYACLPRQTPQTASQGLELRADFGCEVDRDERAQTVQVRRPVLERPRWLRRSASPRRRRLTRRPYGAWRALRKSCIRGIIASAPAASAMPGDGQWRVTADQPAGSRPATMGQRLTTTSAPTAIP